MFLSTEMGFLHPVNLIYHIFHLKDMKRKVKEGESVIIASKGKIPTKKMGVFYNPVMKHNRDISILLLYLMKRKDMNIALPLCGSGVRGIRFLKELPPKTIKNICFNDANPKTFLVLKENLRINQTEEKTEVSNKKADEFFSTSKEYFDYIDIDPFGSPVYFIANALRKLRNQGILALTSTDTSSLCGAYPRVCRRRYFAEPINNSLMYETGTRILIAAAQKEGARYGISLTPLFSYYKDHYIRIFLKAERGKKKTDTLLKEHQYLHFNKEQYELKISPLNNSERDFVAGPLWIGELFEKGLIKRLESILARHEEGKKLQKAIKEILTDIQLNRFLKRITEEKNTPPFYKDLHAVAKTYKTELKPIDKVITKLKEKGYFASRTHFLDTAIKTNAPTEEIIKVMKEKV
jgi:tRNA (guanine26-N2/guanine27-N2)-dimethyltransferase